VLKNLQLTNFRGLEQLELKQLNRVNLIVGDNNTGKTSILEALYLLLASGQQLNDFASAFRATEGESRQTRSDTSDLIERFWLWLFRGHKVDHQLIVQTQLESGNTLKAQFGPNHNYPQNLATLIRSGVGEPQTLIALTSQEQITIPYYPAPGIHVSRLSVRPSNPVEDADQFNQVAIQAGGEEAAESFMRKLEQRLRKLRYRKLRQNSEAVVYAELDGLKESIPSTQLGQAFTRMLHIYCEVQLGRSGVLLADEIENGVYFENLLPFWSVLLGLVENQDAQLFATTHSFECMKAAHLAACERADKGGTYDPNIIRLDRVDWGIKATEFGRETMEVAIANGWEMR
jgi:predicted ATP-dependent endonuclease of OLD family